MSVVHSRFGAKNGIVVFQVRMNTLQVVNIFPFAQHLSLVLLKSHLHHVMRT